MAIKYFKKEYHSGNPGGTVGIGSLDTEHTYNDEGVDYLAKMYYFYQDENLVKIMSGDDFIDVDDLDDLHFVSHEEYKECEELFLQVYQTISAFMLDLKKGTHEVHKYN